MIVWLQDKLQDSGGARIDPSDRGFLLGDGLFETIAVRGQQILRLEKHLARLRDGCAVIGMPYPDQDTGSAIRAVLDTNKMTDAAVRLTWTRGNAARGVAPPENPQPTLLISCAPLLPTMPLVRCIIATVTRRNEHSPLAHIKSLNYLDNILARQEANAHDANDALLLNTAGHLAEATASNLFIVKQGRVLTPPVADGALPGIMRAEILAATDGTEQSLSPEDLASADEIFLTNSLGIRAVVKVNGQTVGQGVMGPVTGKLMTAYI